MTSSLYILLINKYNSFFFFTFLFSTWTAKWNWRSRKRSRCQLKHFIIIPGQVLIYPRLCYNWRMILNTLLLSDFQSNKPKNEKISELVVSVIHPLGRTNVCSPSSNGRDISLCNKLLDQGSATIYQSFVHVNSKCSLLLLKLWMLQSIRQFLSRLGARHKRFILNTDYLIFTNWFRIKT